MSNPDAKAKMDHEGWSEEKLRARINILSQTIRNNSPMAGGGPSAPDTEPVSTGDPVDDELARRGLK